MGELFLHDLNKYINNYGCKVFVETGTGKGTGLSHALKYSFDEFHSIEIIEELNTYNKEQFKRYNNVNLVNTDSLTGLRQILSGIPDNRRIFFWLDAHFPGADFQIKGYSYDDKLEKKIKIPLDDELKLIMEMRTDCQDTFILDDLNLYEEGNYELGMSRLFGKLEYNGLGWIESLFSKTHNMEKDFRHQGFLIITPKG